MPERLWAESFVTKNRRNYRAAAVVPPLMDVRHSYQYKLTRIGLAGAVLDQLEKIGSSLGCVGCPVVPTGFIFETAAVADFPAAALK
jgi:hypothetical protein